MLNYLAKRLFGTRNDRVLKELKPFVQRVNELEKNYKPMSDDELKAQTVLFREKLSQGASLDDIMAEAFAVVREASWRVIGQRHFDVQLIGGAVLHQGRIAEMRTGEGKTLVATLPSYLNALSGKGVHVVTVNDYLARRDAEWMGRIHNFLGLSVGCIYVGLSEEVKRKSYQADVTYGQNNEFGFDYLRDNMKFTKGELMQRGHAYAIVDEVDSILIDEARTPLIISGPAEESTDKYHEINRIIPRLDRQTEVEVDLKTKQPTLTDAGVAKVEELLDITNLYDPANIELLHHVSQGLRAHTTLQRDSDYVVKDGQVIIVDEFTGRLMTGRRWSNGLHQAVEAKEGLRVARENHTLASVTFQNYFRGYTKLSGMTGTADTEASEFQQIYNLEVIVIPTNRPMVRNDMSDKVFRTRREKYEAVCEDIVGIHKTGQPILVGTISIEQSEALSKVLTSKSIVHNVLNAKQHEREADIVAQAGRFGAVTISTNMAGRGTDILLGGNPEFMAAAETKTRDPENLEYRAALEKYQAQCIEEKAKVREAGGLYIMGTERHESRRIDNQLRGRAGRQGDQGASRFYVSLEDDLMLRFGGEKMQALMQKLGWEEGLAIDGRLISHSIESAQRRVEGFHFESRKHVTEYDDVMSKQRQVIYGLRHRVLFNDGVRDEIRGMIDDLIEAAIFSTCDEKLKPLEWKIDELKERIVFLTNRPECFVQDLKLERQEMFDTLRKSVANAYDRQAATMHERLLELDKVCKEKGIEISLGQDRTPGEALTFEQVEQSSLLETLDHLWNRHLAEMDHLREGIGWRGLGQKNPLYEYQREAFILFQELMNQIQEVTVRRLFYYVAPDPRELLKHIEDERKRRESLEKQQKTIHDSPQG